MKKVMLSLLLVILVLGFVVADSDNEQEGSQYVNSVNAVNASHYDDSENDMADVEDDLNDSLSEYEREAGKQLTEYQREQAKQRAEVRAKIREGEYEVEGERLRIEQKDQERLRLHADNVSAETELELEEGNRTLGEALRARLSNGKFSLVKILPDRASETARERLRLNFCNESNNCTIELKEVGQGNQTRAAYEVRAEKQARILGLFRTQMQVESQIDAENGDVISENRPWWAFLASEEDETQESQ